MVTTPYTLEQAESDIANLRGLVDKMSEIITFTTSFVPPTPAAGSSLFSLGGDLEYASSDGNTYITGRQSVYCTADTTINSTTQSEPTSMGVNLGVGHYIFHAVIAFVATGANGSYLTMSGSATTSFFLATIDGQAYGRGVNPQQTTLGTNTGLQSSTLTIGDQYTTKIDGLIFVTVAGTFNVSAAATANTTTFKVQAGSLLEIFPVPT